MERIPKSMRYKIARSCLSIASLFKFAAKVMSPGVTVEVLTVPGWSILGYNLLKISSIKKGLNPISLKNGLEWHSYEMPEEYCRDMHKLMRRLK